MPLFYFHLRTPDGLEEDKIGLSLSDLEDAHREVLLAIPDLTAEMMRIGRSPFRCVFEITDEKGQILGIAICADDHEAGWPRRRSARHLSRVGSRCLGHFPLGS
jgi:hypothetical protein